MSSPQLKVRASELQNKKRDELVKQLEELKTELVSLRVQKIAGGNASKLARM
jgi:large subunit ribosomal protein L35e